ncbi:MAG: hypothetical protein HKN20_06950 [Gemmatimonadetes bacterium]|nr:hypothetical protein [Gemmatimonadota bacterium]
MRGSRPSGFPADAVSLLLPFYIPVRPYSDILERLLRENVLPFWERHAVDELRGGYHLNHDGHGRDRGPAHKRAVAQARMLWFFSAVARSPYGNDFHRESAHHGFAFIKRALIDPAHGGVFWEVDENGKAPTEPGKHLYAQFQAIYALAEYHAMTDSPEAAELARGILSRVNGKARDREHGGYKEAMTRDWTPLPSGARTLIGTNAGDRTLNTNLHIMETLLAIDEWGESRQELEETVERLFACLVRDEPVSGIQAVRDDWSRKALSSEGHVSYGHDLELGWLARLARERLGSSLAVGDKPERLIQNALRYGFDRKRGGFFKSGPAGASATAKDKIWWVQAEGLLALLPPDGPDEEAFAATLDWIDKKQADATGGEWHERVRPILGPKGRKAGPWKAGYHTGRALLRSLDHLKAPEGTSSQSTQKRGENA